MENELVHYGTLGMRWGVRRYQNRDGTLTAEGRQKVAEHYRKATNKRNTLQRKSNKAEAKYEKAKLKVNSGKALKYQTLKSKASIQQYKVSKKERSIFSTEAGIEKAKQKAENIQAKVDRLEHKYEKAKAIEAKREGKYLKAHIKAEKWVQAMDKVFTADLIAQLNAA